MWKLDALSPQISAIDFEDDTLGSVLDKTLQNKRKFELFIQWMYKEFSAEAGLCFIELVQFKKALIDFLKKKDKGSKFDTALVDLLNDGVPQSSIVFVDEYGVDGIAKFKSIAHRLFQKYIRQGAEFEVNISFVMRLEYTRTDENGWNMEAMDLVQVFDNVIKEMLGFMRQSFFRYKERHVDREAPSSPSVTSPSSPSVPSTTL